MEKRIKRSEDSLRDFWDSIKHSNILIFGVPEGEGKEGKLKSTQRNNAWKLPNLAKDINPQFQETKQIPNRINP